jgi:hypothetical protein
MLNFLGCHAVTIDIANSSFTGSSADSYAMVMTVMEARRRRV